MAHAKDLIEFVVTFIAVVCVTRCTVELLMDLPSIAYAAFNSKKEGSSHE
jgi:hypothetical protein